MVRSACASLSNAFSGLSISLVSPLHSTRTLVHRKPKAPFPFPTVHHARPFSSTIAMQGTWLEPKTDRTKSMFKGRCRVPTGGSTKGTTVVWGDYGLRMIDHGRRITAKQLKCAEDTIRARLRGEKYRLYKRICCNLSVHYSGNEMRMGKGKGSFDHWAARVAVSQVVLELRGMIHEKVARDAFRLAGNKLPGQWEFVKKGDPPVVGITKLDGVTLEELKRPRRKLAPANVVSVDQSATASDAATSVPSS